MMARVLLGAALMAIILNGLVTALPGPDLMDFGSFVASGQAASQGADPYGTYPLTFHVILPGFESWNPNLNPPPSLPLFHLLSTIEPHAAFRWWWGVSFLCFGVTVWLLARRYGKGPMAVMWAMALAGFWDTLVLGQIYLPLVLAATAAWLLLDRGEPWLAGLLIGIVVAVKPNFLVWPALLLLAGHWRPVSASIVSAAFLAVVPLFLYGPQVYGQWADLVMNDTDRAVFLTNASLAGLARRMGMAWLGSLASATLLMGAAATAWSRRPSSLEASALALVVSVLASPIAWVHYTLFLLPIFFSRSLSPSLLISAVLLTVPVPEVLRLLDAPAWTKASLGSAYVWAVVLCLFGLVFPRKGKIGGTAPEVEHPREEGAL